ncbi:hypothetical protein [Nonomuraea sp. NPDC059022]|uniref:hypothetical protein n=1 Tax=Nonomuraea sp. NPDC059022 TaxID=3346705 RepID=UPI00368B8177
MAEAAARAAERQEQAARSVEMAERRYAAAQKASQRAVEGLNEARRQAKERLEDLELAVRGGALDEEGAALAVQRAKERLDAIVNDPFASDLDKKEADLAYRQALQRLDEVRERNGDLREEQAEANRRGVEGSKEVEAAKERIESATQAQADAEYNLRQSREAAAKAAVEGARAIAAAERGVADAIKGVTAAQKGVEAAKKAEERARRAVRDALWQEMLANERLVDAKKELIKAQKAAAQAARQQGAGVSAVTKAMDNLSPAGQRFARFIAGTLNPRLKDMRFAVQEALLPGLQEGVTKGLPLLDTLEDGLVDTGKVIGDLAKEWGAFVSSKSFRRDLATVMKSNTKIVGSFGRAGKSALGGVMNILVVAAPYAEKLAGLIERGASRFERWTKTARGDGSMARWFEEGWKRAKQLFGIVRDVGAGILELGKLAAPAGGTLLDDLSEAARDFREWASDPANQEQIRKFFEDTVVVVRALGRLLKGVTDLLFTLTETLGGETLSGFIDTLTTIVGWLDVLAGHPVTGELIKWALYISGVALALGLVIGKVSAVVKAFQKIPGVTKLVQALSGQVGKLVGLLGKVTGLSGLFGGRKTPGGGKDDDKDGPLTKVGTMTVYADKVYINGDDDGSSGRRRKGDRTGSPDVDVPDSDGKGGRHRKTPTGSKLGGKGVAGIAAAIAASLGLDALADIDWGKEIGKAGGKLAGLGGKVKGGVVGTIAGLLVDPIVDAVKGDANKGMGNGIAEAVKQGVAGAGLGAAVGSIIPGIGTAIGAAVGGAIGAVKGGIQGFLGERVWGNLLGTGFSADGVALALAEVGKLFGGVGPSIQQKWAAVWAGLDKGTQAGSEGLGQRIGTFLDLTSGKFVGLAKDAPASVQKMWADIKKDLDAGISPSQAKIDAFIRAGGGSFLKLGKDAPADLREGWRQALLGIDTFTSTGANKLGTFIRGAGAQFATLKNDAPQHVRQAWAAIQRDLDAGIPPSQKKIDDFIAAGGSSFVKLKKDAPQALRDALGEINRDLQSGLATAALKLGQFVTDGGAKFLRMRQDAPAPLRAMWGDIQRDIDAGKTPSQAKIKAFVDAGGGSFLKLSKDAPASLKKGWSDIAAGVDPGLAPAKSKLAAVAKDMEKSFGTAKAGIQKVWEALPDAVKKPIRDILNTAYAKIKEVWNAVASKVGFTTLPNIPAFAKGGVVAGGHGVQPGYSPGKDTMLAAVSPGEAWLRPELARALGTRWVNGGNRAARVGGVAGAARFLAGGLAFAKGGKVPGGGSTASGKAGGKKPKEQSPLDKLLAGLSAAWQNIFRRGLGAGARTVLNPVKEAVTRLIGNRTEMQRLMAGVPRKLIDGVIARFDGKDNELNRDRGGVLPPGRSLVRNATGKDEWVLNPDAVAALGGPGAVAALNAGRVAALYRASRGTGRPAPRPQPTDEGGARTINVYPQPGQDEYTIGRAAARRLGSKVPS